MNFWQALSFTGTDTLVPLSKQAEDVGFTGVMVADHLVTPETITSRYPYTEDGVIWWDPATHWPDPWVAIGAMATHTTTLEFMTSIYVLPMHELYGAAKGLSTAAFLAGGRVTLAIGVGWMEQEFALTGQDFHTRGRRTDEMLEVMAKLCTGQPAEHHGEFFDFDTMTMLPAPSEPIRVLVGGESQAAFARAARHDGWFGGGPFPPDAVPPLLRQLERHRAESGRAGDPFRVMVGLAAAPDLDLYRRLADEGVTDVPVLPWYYSVGPEVTLSQKLDAMARFADEFIEPLRQ